MENHASDTAQRPDTDNSKMGPNGGRMEVIENGDLVEWLPDEENPGEEVARIRLRGADSIDDATNDLTDLADNEQARHYSDFGWGLILGKMHALLWATSDVPFSNVQHLQHMFREYEPAPASTSPEPIQGLETTTGKSEVAGHGDVS